MRNSLKWGLALSGGGARGIVHIGVLQSFDNHDFKPSCIAGTSMGAIVGGLYAGGMKPTDMIKALSSVSFLRMLSLLTRKSGILDMKILNRILEDNLPQTFEELDMPFFAAATNLTKDEIVIFHTGPLHRAITASASIPIIFPPVDIDGDKYVDGGLIDNLPATACKPHCDRVLGVALNHGTFAKKLESTREVALEVFHTLVKRNTREGLRNCDSIIRPYLDTKYGLLDFSRADELFEIGLIEGERWISDEMN